MEYLIELLNCLNKGERDLLQQNLDTNPNLKRTKLIQSLLARGQFFSSDRGIGPTESNNYQLAYSTKEWLFGLILQQDAYSKLKSEVGRKHFLAYKYLLLASLCVGRGLRRDSIEYLVKAQKIARKYEFLIIEMETVNELILEWLFKDKQKELEKLRKRQLELEVLISISNRVHWIRLELNKNRMDNSNVDKESKNFFKSKLKELKQLADKSGLVEIKSYYLRANFRYHSNANDFEAALETARAYLDLVDDSPMLRMSSNKGGGNMQIATTLNRLGQFKKAVPYSETALKNFGKTRVNNEIGSHVLFTSIFHLKRYDQALQLTKKYQRHKWMKKFPLRLGKWHFFEAAVHFNKGEYDHSMTALRNSQELLKDRSGWQYGYRILEILIQYENDGAEILENYITNFRRFIRGHTVQSKTRISLILKVLSALEKSQFNFKRIAKSHVRMLRTLEEGKGLYFYEPSGFELIRFDQWFRKHLKKAK